MITATQSVTAAGSGNVLDALRSASRKTGLDFDFLLNTAMRESSLNAHAKSKTSSATGLFQFIEQTWLGLVKRYGERYGLGAFAGQIEETGKGRYAVASPETKAAILALRKDPELSAVMAGESAKQTKQSLECVLGREVCGGELYAAHFLGPSGARQLIRLNESDPQARADLAFPQAAKANRAIFYHADGSAKAVGEVYAWAVDRPPVRTIPVLKPELKEVTPRPQQVAENFSAKEARDVFASFAPPAAEAKEIAPLSEAKDERPTYRAPTYTAWTASVRPAPVEVRALPQSPLLLTPGVVEILALLSPVTTTRQTG